MIRTRFILASLALTLVLDSASVAHAQQKAPDGAILIPQGTVIGGLPGDANGFPITITQPGLYRLTGNIVVPGSTGGILITASNVTIDLNGFSIIGSGFSPTGTAISGDGQSRVRILNGIISGFVSGLSFMGASDFITVERLHIDTTFTNQAGFTGAGIPLRAGQDKAARAIIRDVITTGQMAGPCRRYTSRVQRRSQEAQKRSRRVARMRRHSWAPLY